MERVPEFYVGEVKVGEVTSIAAEATAVQFTTADSDPTNVELQASITAGGVVTVKLFDAAGNHATSSVDNPTLVVGYAAPSPSAFTATATAVGATSNAAGLLGLYSNDNLLPDGASGTPSTNLTANIPATITVAPRGSITSATLKVSDAAGNFATDTRNVVLGTTSNETLNGTSGKDFIYGFAGNDTLSGGDGDDTLLGGDGDDNLTGGADNDTFKVDAGTDTITDLATGDIFVVGGPSPESSASMTANNVANFVATNQTQGSHYVGSVTLNAAAAGSTIDVSLASVVHGFTLVGSDGVDNLTGTTANDTITGGAGADVLTGGAGNDTLTGGVDNDTFNVDAGTDTITDLTTGDVLVVSSGATANATSITAFTASSGTVQSGTATLSTADAGGTINVAATSGSTGFTLNGGNGVDNLTGSGAADIINGGAGNDVLNGGAGNDTITGGAGADAINVGTGTDLVVLRDNDSAANNETGSSVSTSGMDIYTGLGVGDQLEIYRSIT